MSSDFSSHRLALATVLLALILALAFQGSRGLWGPDEGRYSNIALQMVDSGDWLVPRRHPEHTHFTKPPLTYWSIAVAVETFGRNEFALRLTNGLSMFASVLLLIGLGRRLTPAAPWLPGIIFATSVVPFAAANWINTDYLLTVFETLAMLGFVHLWQAPDARAAGRGRALMWTGFALAFMTKGPPGLLPLLPILVFVLLESRDSGQPRLRLVGLGSLSLFALIALPWYALVIAKVPGLLDYFVHDEVYGRVFTDMHDRSSGRFGVFKVYAPMVLVAMLPWAWVLWRRLPGIWRERSRLRQWWRQRDPIDRLLLSWIALPALVFALSTSKMPLYVLPLLVPVALLIARRLLPLGSARRRRVLVGAALSAILLLAIKGLAPALMPHAKDARELANLVQAQFQPLPAEVVFIDESAQYGLKFYLGVDVEHVTLLPGSDADIDSTLADELLEDEQRAWVTTRDRIERTQAALMPLGYRFRERAALGQYVLGTIDRGNQPVGGGS